MWILVSCKSVDNFSVVWAKKGLSVVRSHIFPSENQKIMWLKLESFYFTWQVNWPRTWTPFAAQWILWHYIICRIILTFWLVLTYDLSEDRRIDNVINMSFLVPYYIKQVDSMLLFVCSLRDHSKRQNEVRISMAHSAIASGSEGSCFTFLFFPSFDVICDLLLNRRTATWNLFVKQIPNLWTYILRTWWKN